MRRDRTSCTSASRPLLVVHPSPDLYGSDRMLVEAVRRMVEDHGDVVVALPSGGRLVPLLLEAGARVWEVPTLVLRKRLLRPAGWPYLLRDSVVGTLAALRTIGRLRPEAVYVNTQTLPLWPLLSRCSGARTVVHVHEAEEAATAPVRTILAAPLLPAHRVLVNSEFSRAVLLRSVPALGGRTTVVANGVPGPPDGPRPARPEIGERLRIVYLGRLSERKGVQLVVGAVGALRDRGVEAVLDIVGDIYPGYEWFERQLHDAVADAEIQDRVRFRGFHAVVWPWLEDADVVVVPSVKAEPFGNTAVEAVLAARPVIVADHSGLREAVAGFRSAQFVDTRSADAVVELVDALVQVRDDWEAFKAAALVDEAVARVRHRPEEFGQHVAAAVTARAE